MLYRCASCSRRMWTKQKGKKKRTNITRGKKEGKTKQGILVWRFLLEKVNFSRYIPYNDDACCVQVRELFKENVFLSKDPMNRMTLIDSTLPKAVKADKILRDLRREKREATADEQALIDEVEACREIIIQVCFSSLSRLLPSFCFVSFRCVLFRFSAVCDCCVIILWEFCIFVGALILFFCFFFMNYIYVFDKIRNNKVR